MVTVEQLVIFDLFDCSSEDLGFLRVQQSCLKLIYDYVFPLKGSFEFQSLSKQLIEAILTNESNILKEL